MELALFDFDHTITTGDSYGRFLRRVATPQQLAQARWTIGPWLAGYRIGPVSAAALRRRATKMTFAGRRADEIARHGERHAAEELPAMLCPEMMEHGATGCCWCRPRSTSISPPGAAHMAWSCCATGSNRPARC